jgi:UDP-N-acetylmuramoylalanine--D-glutamate ligase
MLLETPTQPKALTPTIGIVELLLSRSPAPVVVIAGASGKSATAATVAEMLHASGCGVVLGLREALDALTVLSADDRIVIELTPSVAVAPHAGPSVLALTGLAADELPADQNPAAVAAALRPTVSATTDAFVFNGADAKCRMLARIARADVMRVSATDPEADVAFLDDEVVVRESRSRNAKALCEAGQLRRIAPLHQSNLLLAAATAIAAGAEPRAVAGVLRRSASAMDGRDVVAESGGVTWVNDAAATRPGRTVAALEASNGNPVLLIAGGQHGGQPLAGWARAAGKARYVLLFGADDGLLAATLEDHNCRSTIVRCADLDDAVLTAARLANRGDTVLFSPGCEPDSPLPPSPGDRFHDLATMPRAARQEAA